MRFANFLKKELKKIPIGITMGNIISKLPSKYRIGIAQSYRRSKAEIFFFDSLLIDGKKIFIFNKFKKLIHHAYANIPFYKIFYDINGYQLSQLQNYDDIKNVPIINKKILRKYSLNERSSYELGSDRSNTGGTSGTPLNFYTPSIALGHELAHLEYIWSHIDFKHTDLRLILVGRSNVKRYVEYDYLRHALIVDIYSDYNKIFDRLVYFSNKCKIKYIHGYPSAIYDFCNNLILLNNSLYFKIKKSLKGVIYNSEFPQEHMRNFIEKEIFNLKSQAFYGHTERCIMAYEDSKKYYNYKAMQTYGFCEVIDDNLIGTSYNNFISPFIRYNTEDVVNDFKEKDGLISSFILNHGRSSDYVLDFNNKKIPLTGLIFGRHHPLFDYCNYIQIFQENRGYALILYVLKSSTTNFKPELHFDSSNIRMDFKFKEIKKPIKSKNGKILLLVKEF